MAKRLCLVTGASSGIGAALAREYAKRNWDLALVARRGDRLEALAKELKDAHGTQSLIIVADLADPKGPETVVKAVEKAGRHVDGLVNNAGYGLPGTYVSTSWAQQSYFIQLMLTSYAELVHRLLPGMVERGYGRIINVSSLSAFPPGAKGHTLYAAVKAALIKFSQSLHLETEGSGVHVTALCPGFTYSEFHDVNETRHMVSKLPKRWWRTAEAVAHDGYWAAETNVPVRVSGNWNKFIAAMFLILPMPLGIAWMRRSTRGIRSTEPPKQGPVTAPAAAAAKPKPAAPVKTGAASKTAAAKKPAARKAPAKKPAAKKPAPATPAKTGAASKTAAAKKPAAKKPAAKKAPARKPAARKARPQTPPAGTG
ncbi:MAG: SDR family oxidoreductase [Maricaulaceae bacterium]|nr:SDR family oxidoreductase [Maricaulaceae bacterium]